MQVIKPGVGIIRCPLVQLALDPEYLLAPDLERWYSPATSSHSRRAMQARCSPSPCARRSRALTTTRAPPPTGAISGRCASPARQSGRRRHRSGSHVHCRSLDAIGAQLLPCGPAATLTRPCITDPAQRIRDAHRAAPLGQYEDCAHGLTQPVSIGFEPGSTLNGVLALVTSLRLSVLLAAPTRSDSSRVPRRCQDCLPPFPTAPGSDCPQLHRAAATAPRRGLAPRTTNSASWRTLTT